MKPLLRSGFFIIHNHIILLYQHAKVNKYKLSQNRDLTD